MNFERSEIMENSKYRKFLNIILIIAIIALVALVGVWIYQEYEQYVIEKDAEKAIEEFEEQLESEGVIIAELTPDEEKIEVEEPIENNPNTASPTKKVVNTTNKTNNKTNTTTTPTRKKYKGFYMLGYIQIPRTGVRLPLLESVSVKALNVAAGVLMTPGINQPGNTTIMGHNYRNKSLFSKNGQIRVGDKIYITDEAGNKLKYIVYNTYITSEDDADYMTRDTGGAIEISLSTCTNDNANRIIIWARAE